MEESDDDGRDGRLQLARSKSSTDAENWEKHEQKKEEISEKKRTGRRIIRKVVHINRDRPRQRELTIGTHIVRTMHRFGRNHGPGRSNDLLTAY